MTLNRFLNRRNAAVWGALFIFVVAAAHPVFADSGKNEAATVRPAAVAVSAPQRISIGSDGVGGGEYAALSSDGTILSFESHAGDLLPGQIEDSRDTFVLDRVSSALERASTSSDGTPAYNPGDYTAPPVVSASGRYVAFMSRATGLTENDNNGMPDIFLHDRETGQTELISVNLDGEGANDGSFNPAISEDGRYVAFQSLATDLVEGDNNGAIDVFVRDRQTGQTTLVSVNDFGEQGTHTSLYGYSSVSISADGRYIAFSYNWLVVDGAPVNHESKVFLRDQQAGTTRYIAEGEYPALSSNGNFLAFVSDRPLVSGDQNSSTDVYVYDLNSGAFERVSVTSQGDEVPEHYLHSAPDITADGRFVVFETEADNLVPQDQNGLIDIYLRDRVEGTTMLISSTADGNPGSGNSHHPVISDDGKAIAFTSSANDLVPGDANERSDVFVVDLAPQPVVQQFENRVYLPVVQNP